MSETFIIAFLRSLNDAHEDNLNYFIHYNMFSKEIKSFFAKI